MLGVPCIRFGRTNLILPHGAGVATPYPNGCAAFGGFYQRNHRLFIISCMNNIPVYPHNYNYNNLN